MNVVLHFDTDPEIAELWIKQKPSWMDISIVSPSDDKATRTHLADAEVLLHVLEPVNCALMNMAPRLRLIQKVGIGVNTIDITEADRRQIQVANMPGSNSTAVAEMTLALMLAAMRNIVALDSSTKSEPTAADPSGWTETPMELYGKTVGLVGFGSIPRHLAPILRSMGARVIHTSRSMGTHWASDAVSLDELALHADVISLHAPLTSETWGMIDARFLSTIKTGVVFVNTARGELVDEDALYEALNSGRIRCAALDVMDNEPVKPDNPLLQLPNVIVTPHVAWLTYETMEKSVEIAYENCRRLREGLPIIHRVSARRDPA